MRYIIYRKHLLLFGLLIATILLFVAIRMYPGGSQIDINSIGYDWSNNYLCNLFDPIAVNGVLDICSILICSSFGYFFYDFSEKINSKKAANTIKFSGIASMFFAFLIVTPYHNQMIIISSLLALISISYITVYIFKSRLYYFKTLCILSLLSLFVCNYVYYTKTYLEYLPILQKIALLLSVLWIILLHYFTAKSDFSSIY